jgi:CRISPR-associated endonuclease/helicase Cas3
MATSLDQIARWPGKSASEGAIEHPALYHMLDVAAVAEVLIAPFKLTDSIKDALVLLTALHDLGKINSGFRAMLRSEGRQSFRHWEMTEVHLNANIDLLVDALCPDRPNRLASLIGATAGHHGRPSKLDRIRLDRATVTLTAEAKEDGREAIHSMATLWPGACLSGMSSRDVTRLSWWLSGLVTTADWIGSNTDWFTAVPPGLALPDYLDRARGLSPRAVREAGLSGSVPSGASLFDWPELRPMQQACKEIPLNAGPMLAIIEDETGAGKTEAALILAQRMTQAGKGRGLFFALPTMATADAMFSRVSKTIGRMFVGKPSITLAHGRAGLSGDYSDIVRGRPNAPEDIGCTDWLADSRRRALLADVGVGTIDQALLSVLPVKFQTLRHFGLSSKILIVDEVHELGEAYIAVTLAHLLKMHRDAGGSAILLTATLPMDLRKALLAVYNGGDDADPGYPALTIAGGTARRDLPQETGPKGAVRVERLPDDGAAVALVTEKARQGAACVWIRNAVDDAISAVQALRCAGVQADLLHARFALGDRKRIEASARARFGKEGEDRAGHVLVGTQVLESSLDLDFDVMVSDLAPMAGLVQRAGRLWRHMDLRPRSTRPVPAPVLYVLSPDPAQVTDSRWLSTALDKGAYVYSADVMWRTAHYLFDAGHIVAPSGIRALIEYSYSDEPPLPEPLVQADINRAGTEASHRALAWQNVVDLDVGYRAGGQANDDATYPTRLGQEQRMLVLAREEEGVLVPFFDESEGWAMSEVSAASYKFEGLNMPDQQAERIQTVTGDWPEWKRASHWLCPVDPEGEICAGLGYSESYGLIFKSL